MFIKKRAKPQNLQIKIIGFSLTGKKNSHKQFISGSILEICVTKRYLKYLPKKPKIKSV